MYKVELKIDGRHLNSVVYPKTLTVGEIETDNDLARFVPMVFKIDNEFASRSVEVTKDTRLDCTTYSTFDGQRIYQDTAIFIMMKAFRRLFPLSIKLVVKHSIGDGVYCRVTDETNCNVDDYTNAETVAKLKAEMQKIVDSAYPIEARRMSLLDAKKLFEAKQRQDMLLNLETFDGSEIVLFKCGEYYDYYVRQLAENTSSITKFDIQEYMEGFLLRFPERIPNTPEGKLVMKPTIENHPKLFETHREHERWLQILGVDTVGELNRLIRQYEITELVQLEEALHEKKIAQIADLIKARNEAKIVLIAGPSSSAKTTFAKRLSIQLRINGLVPQVIGLDDYFQPRNLTPKKPGGEYDYECIEALDLAQLNQDLSTLLQGGEVTLPRYNFQTGMRESSYHTVRMHKNDILVMEGIHGLNDRLTESIPLSQKVRVYVSPLNQLNIDYHNRIPTTDVRKVRRIARDYRYRSYSAEQTLSRWDSIREGEEIYIFPYQENADAMFNSSLTYELGVLKKEVMPLLAMIQEPSPVYLEARRLMRLLDHFRDIDDRIVPTNSILREFTYGSSFKY